MLLKDKVAVITGGAGLNGLGFATARMMVAQSAKVAILDLEGANPQAAAVQLGAEHLGLVGNVTDKAACEAAVAQIKAKFGRIDILVNSGSAPGGSASAVGPIEGIIDDELIWDFNVKYVGALRCSRAVIPHMKQSGWGRIINISGATMSVRSMSAGVKRVLVLVDEFYLKPAGLGSDTVASRKSDKGIFTSIFGN